MAKETAEVKQFGMHPKLLFDVINRQAGSISKAILEGIQNSIDADATYCDIHVNQNTFSIEDDGRGIVNREEIDSFFATFGTPHADGDATYGRFRMGRGQLFSFGRNIWRTNIYVMDVDIKNHGLNWSLHELDPDNRHSGCRIDVALYEQLLPSDLDRLTRDLRDMVTWAPIPVYLNERQISQPPEAAKWTLETEDAYVSLLASKATLDIYNIGILVCREPSHRYGTGGTVVSKKALTVNFARNAVQERECPIWQNVAKEIRKRQGQNISKKNRLNDAERANLAERIIACDVDKKTLQKAKVITDVSGRHHTLQSFIENLPRRHKRIVVAQRGDQLSETAHKRKMCFSLATDTLQRFNVAKVNELLAAIENTAEVIDPFLFRVFSKNTKKIEILDREDLTNYITSEHIPLAENELKPAEHRILLAIRRGNLVLSDRLLAQDKFPHSGPRTIHLGVSDTAYAWTDGHKQIWFDRRYIMNVRNGFTGCYQIAMTLLHEYLHDSADTDSHIHDHDFYETFHDLAGDPDLDPVGECARITAKNFADALRQEDRKPNRGFLLQEDVDNLLTTLGAKISENEKTSS